MRKIFYPQKIVLLSFLFTLSCNSLDLVTKNDVRSDVPILQVGENQIDQKLVHHVEISKHNQYQFTDNFRASIELVTAQHEDQKPRYDPSAQEGLLTFTILSNWIDDQKEERGIGYRTTYCSKWSYLFTKVNQRQTEEEGFDNHEAKIFLKNHQEIIEVGRYQKPSSSMNDGEKFKLWISPVLCEGEYASVCRIETSLMGDGERLGENLQLSVQLLLKNDKGEEKIGLTSVTPTTSKIPPFEYFGCDSIAQ